VRTRPAVAVIVNPASSNGKTLRRWPGIERALREGLGELEARLTEAPGHAIRLTREALDGGAELVVSVGGDGTNNEVLCGFVDEQGKNLFPRAELGLVSSGTGGDFCRHLGRVPIEEQVERLVRGSARPIDYGIARFVDEGGRPCVRPFLNVVSVGLSGLGARYIRGRSGKIVGAKGTYLLGAIRGIVAYRNQPVRMAIDGEASAEVELTVAAVANGQFFAGGMWIAPQAACDDGLLDLVWAEGLSRSRMIGVLGKVFRGRHIGSRGVYLRRGSEAQLSPRDEGQEVLIEVDGEQLGRLPLSVRSEPGGLRLRGP
jgi:YegS/Rv2252/BmrU family lipid kinase